MKKIITLFLVLTLVLSVLPVKVNAYDKYADLYTKRETSTNVESEGYTPLKTPVHAAAPFDFGDSCFMVQKKVIVDALGNKHIIGLGFTDSIYKDKIVVAVLDADNKLLRKFAVAKEMPYFGSAAMDAEGNYYMFFAGNNIYEEDTKKVIAIAKYNSTGKILGTLSLTGRETNTTSPFSTAINPGSPYSSTQEGAASMAISDNVLAVHFCRNMRRSGDGLKHQASTAIYVDINTMKEINYKKPYVSHSFEQQVITARNGSFLFANTGDGYPRGFEFDELIWNGDDSLLIESSPFSFRSIDPYQVVNAELGGIAESSYGYLLVGTSERVLDMEEIPSSECGTRDLFFQMIRKDFGLSESGAEDIISIGETRIATTSYDSIEDYGVVWLTTYQNEENAYNPTLFETENGFLILWNHRSTETRKEETWYILLNEDGSVAKTATQLKGLISPLWYVNTNVWYENGKLCWLDWGYEVILDEYQSSKGWYHPVTLNTITLYNIPTGITTASTGSQKSIQAAINKELVPTALQKNYNYTITRQEFCKLAVRWLEAKLNKPIAEILSDNKVTINKEAFSDTADTDVLAAYALGLTTARKKPTATTQGTYAPNSKCTREQAALILRNTCKIAGIKVSNVASAGFVDISEASSSINDSINFVYNKKLMAAAGTAPLQFAPKSHLTREQAILAFYSIK